MHSLQRPIQFTHINHNLLKNRNSQLPDMKLKEGDKKMSAKVLVVDDDANIVKLLKLYLEKEEYNVITASNGAMALSMFKQENPAIIILDIMMPEMDGNQVCREIRKTSDVPIIMLTAKGETFDKVLSLELGADDYMVKPFDPKELIARVKAILRRSESKKNIEKGECISFDKLEVNLTNYELKIDGRILEIPPKELELLYFLSSNPNRVFTREQLLEEVWGFDYFGDSRTVDVHIKRLREKLEGVEANWQLKTVWGVGYKFEVRSDV